MPSESWVEDNLLYYVFDLIADVEGALPPMALFIVEREQRKLLLVRLVTPNVASTEVEVQTIYHLEGVDHGRDA
jgi:hypothetical protein